ncbi:MAG TPA: imidazolonepropionase, partial [Candidatus Cryptobacteroides sp.]|nr:imidazolonepropionase [Candidatus Cryptobacteroides sp.]
MKTLIKNIGLLAGISDSPRKEGADMGMVHCLKDAWLLMDGEFIADFGGFSMDELSPNAEETLPESDFILDAEGAMLMPAFCDSHTHVVYAGSRLKEFEDKIKGLSYAEIAARGGGILNSADRTHSASEEELYEQSMERVLEMMAKGSGAIEIKSGYGLNTADELKMLRVIRRI